MPTSVIKTWHKSIHKKINNWTLFPGPFLQWTVLTGSVFTGHFLLGPVLPAPFYLHPITYLAPKLLKKAAKIFPLTFFHGAFAPSFIWCRRPWTDIHKILNALDHWRL